MGASAGYAATVKLNGTSTAYASEAMTELSGSNPTKIYQVTDAAKRVINPSVSVVVKDDAATVSAALYEVDYLFGKIRFLNYTVLGTITIFTGSYFVMWEITSAKAFTLEDGYAVHEATAFNSTGNQERILGLRDASGTISHLDDGFVDYDTGAGSVVIKDLLTRGAVLIELTPIVSGDIFRAWAKLNKESVQAAVDGLADGTLSWVLDTRAKWAGCAWSSE